MGVGMVGAGVGVVRAASIERERQRVMSGKG
jgi:hypothetical protein